jgi:hypothetical protein
MQNGFALYIRNSHFSKKGKETIKANLFCKQDPQQLTVQ